MNDLVTILSEAAGHPERAGATFVVGAGLRRILGPSAVAIGGALGDFTDYRLRNLLSIDSKVQERLGEAKSGDDDPVVHPRVAKEVLDEGSWIDDDLHQEYLAGLLVHARSQEAPADDTAYLARIVTNLTAEQVRLHYATVRAYAGHWDGTGEWPFHSTPKNQNRDHAVVVDHDEFTRLYPNASISLQALVRERLFEDYGTLPRPGRFALVPTGLGFDVFRAALTEGIGRPGLMLSRDHLERIVAQNPAMSIHYPDPEPPLFTSATIEYA